MNEKFPITKFIIGALRVIAVIVVVICTLLAVALQFSGEKVDGVMVLVGILTAVFLAFLAELLNIVLEIEKNTRKD
jgi:hypothetical protein